MDQTITHQFVIRDLTPSCLRIIRLMYFDKSDVLRPILAGQEMRLVLSANGIVVLLLGLAPGALMGICIAAM